MSEANNFEAQNAYILSGRYVCHDCSQEGQVFSVLLAGPFTGSHNCLDEINSEQEVPIVRRAAELPALLGVLLGKRSNGRFRKDYSQTAAQQYWMNHCEHCDTKIGDWFVHKPGEAFFPTSESEIVKVTGECVPGPWQFDSPELSLSSWTSIWLEHFLTKK